MAEDAGVTEVPVLEPVLSRAPVRATPEYSWMARVLPTPRDDETVKDEPPETFAA
jgi:hypothetical protein